MKFRIALLLASITLTACVRQLPPETNGLDRLVLTYQNPVQRQEIQSFFEQEGISLKALNAAGGKAEYLFEVPEERIDTLLQRLSTQLTSFRVQRREHSLILLCCQP